MSSTNRVIDTDLSDYLTAVSLREPDLLKKLRAETAAYPNAVMQITPLQGQFISFLIKAICAEKAIEIGVFTGYSSLCIATALPHHGRLVACDINPKWTAVARRYWQAADVAHKIQLRIAPAIETLTMLLDDGQCGTYDFAFIDADKESYEAYYESALALLRPGGLMMVDNVLWKGYVFDPSHTDSETVAIRQFNQNRHQDRRVDISLLPIADGITLVRKRDSF
ncbi:MAG: SAM-dependent methyltransferase [Desulfatitalea sp.]|nr:class I SAM-dependent methyltransferase [Desulfatitalea sp.]NNJ98975.1 SAM-dependent methyltransferase [Desulfatitalea sp.]